MHFSVSKAVTQLMVPQTTNSILELGSRGANTCTLQGAAQVWKGQRPGGWSESRLWSSLRRPREPLVFVWVRVWPLAPEFSVRGLAEASLSPSPFPSCPRAAGVLLSSSRAL